MTPADQFKEWASQLPPSSTPSKRLLSLLAQGMSIEEIDDYYPRLPDDI